jgi:intracellular sulfur oxidation DsrE/DsrF family protein
MNRRNIFRTALAAATGVFGARASAQTSNVPKVVYHLSDLDKVSFVLGNIRNHFEGAGGPDKITIALVVHGPALKAFHKQGAVADISSRTASQLKTGLRLEACANTMAGQNVKLGDLLPGFVVAEKGGVTRLAELQHEGWAYLRP